MGPDAETVARAGLSGGPVFASPTRDVIEPMGERAAAGTLRVTVVEVLDLDHARDGLATLAAGHAHGKLVVTVNAAP